MKTTAIIVAAGKGTRMRSSIAKQYMLLDGKPVLYYALKAYEDSEIDDIVLVVGKGKKDYVLEQIVQKYNLHKVRKVISGGRERYESVYRGLREASGSDYVLIHDGVRPVISADMINYVIEQVQQLKACVMGVRAKDTIKISDDTGRITSTPNRNNTWQIQTPQAFSYKLILDAYNKMTIEYNREHGVLITDDAVIVEHFTGEAVYIIEGSYMNIKITTPEDIYIAESFMKIPGDNKLRNSTF